MQPTPRWTAALPAAGLLLTLLSPLAAAQILSPAVGGFGTQVKVGDADYFPLLKATSAPLQVLEANTGSGALADDCVLLAFDGLQSSGSTARAPLAAGPPMLFAPLKRDIRLVPCMGKAAGIALTDQDTAEKTMAFTCLGSAGFTAGTTTWAACGGTAATVPTLQYVDLNANGKYDKGDYVYLVTSTAAGLVGSTGTGSWTIRLTPVQVPGGPLLPGGVFAMPTDWDFVAYRSAAKTGLTMSLAEREDKGWYLLNGVAFGTAVSGVSAAVPAAAAGTFAPLVPASSIRVGTIPLGTANTFTLQPNVAPLDVALANPDEAEAGKALPILVTIGNTGADADVGVLVTKLAGQIVDVRLSPKLSPTEQAKLVITVPAVLVTHGGAQKLEVNDVVAAVSLKGASAAPAPAEDLSGLRAQVADLQAQVAALRAAPTTAGTVKQQGAPGLAPLALLGGLAAAVLALRRRSQ